MALTAGTPLDVLTNRLQKAGWGDLGTPTLRGLARVLDALASSLDPRSGAGKTTANQLAEKTCYTERWVRRCLTLLEELEIIQWDRGGIVNGQPMPSSVRVSKAVLVDLIHIARAKQGERQTEQAAETRRRLARLRTSYTRPAKRPRDHRKKTGPARRSPHAELSSTLLSTEEVPKPHGADRAGEKSKKGEAAASTTNAQSAAARIRADLATRRRRKAAQRRSNETEDGEPGA